MNGDIAAALAGLREAFGTRDAVRVFERLLTDDDLDASLVLGRHGHTRTLAEQRAVDRYLAAVWSALLATYPARLGALSHARDFLDAVDRAGDDVRRFLHTWDLTGGPAADRHLADLVNTTDFGVPRPGLLGAWLRGETVRDRLYRAFERDHAEPWADDLAYAHDRVPD